MEVERRHVQFVMQPGVMEKLRLISDYMAHGAEVLDKAHALLGELRDSKQLVIAGDSIFIEGHHCAADLADVAEAREEF